MSSSRSKNNLSKRSWRKTGKNSGLSPEQSSGEEATVHSSTKVATRPPAGVASKKSRTSAEQDMDEDFAVVPPSLRLLLLLALWRLLQLRLLFLKLWLQIVTQTRLKLID